MKSFIKALEESQDKIQLLCDIEKIGKEKALKILHEEAMKSFRSGSKAAADFIDAYSKRVSS